MFKLSENNLYKTDDGVKIYDAGVDFSMIVHSIGGIMTKDINMSDSEHWARDPIALDFFSSCYIRNDMMGYVDVKTAMLGFSKVDDDTILDMCNKDYGSQPTFANGLSQTILNTPNTGGCLVPDEMIKNTSAPNYYNEFVMNRIKNGEVIKPDYIIYICDDFEKDTISEKKLTNSTLSGKDAYQNALKTAKQFGVPIVFVERNKILINEKSKIDAAKELLFQAENTFDDNHIKLCIDNIITRYRTNFLGISPHFDTKETMEKYKNTGICLENYLADCNSILEYAKYLKDIDERLSKVVLDNYKEAIKHPPVIPHISYEIEEILSKKYQEVLNNMNELESEKVR